MLFNPSSSRRRASCLALLKPFRPEDTKPHWFGRCFGNWHNHHCFFLSSPQRQQMFFLNKKYKRLWNMEIILKWPSNPRNSSNLLLSWSPPHLQVSQREFQVQKARWGSFQRPKHDTTTRLSGLTQALISHHWGRVTRSAAVSATWADSPYKKRKSKPSII